MPMPLKCTLIAAAATLRQDFQSNRPFPHLVIPDFLDPAFCQRLTEQFPAFDRKRALNEMGEVGGKAVNQHIREVGSAYLEFDRTIGSPEFLGWISQVTGIPKLIHDPEYVGGGTHENREGQDLDPHVDFNYHPKSHLHRRLNLIVFLNPEWREDWGGCLQLHRNPWAPAAEDSVTTILPLMNQAALFETTETSWHGFRRIQLPEDRRHFSRKSLAVYFYTKERPPEQTAPSHSTVYVQRHLPEHIRAGHVLTEEDDQKIRELMSRRDMQIRFLYEREKEFSEVNERLMRVYNSIPVKAIRIAARPWRKISQSLRKSSSTGS